MVVFRFLAAQRRLDTWAPTNATGIDADHHVAVWHPLGRVDAFVVLVLQAVWVAREVSVLHLLLLKGGGFVANAFVVETLPVEAHVHDGGVLPVASGAKDICVNVGVVTNGNLDVGHLDDAADVSAQLVSRGGSAAERSGHLGREHPGTGIELFEQVHDDRVAPEPILPGRGLSVISRRVIERDDLRTDYVVHRGRDRHPVLDVAILIQRLQQPSAIGNQRIVQLVDAARGPVNDLREVHSRRTFRGPQDQAPQQERDSLSRSVAELTLLVRAARGCWGLILQPDHGAGENAGQAFILKVLLRFCLVRAGHKPTISCYSGVRRLTVCG